MTRVFVLAMLFAAGFTGIARAQNTRALIVSGVSGEPRLAQQFERDVSAMRDALAKRFGAAVTVLTEKSTPRADKASMLQALQQLARSSQPGDQVLLVLVGHGSAQGGDARFNIPGPDITAAELAGSLRELEKRTVAVVVATSSSGAFIEPLSAPGRVVVTATKSGGQNEEVVFGGHFARALSEDVADTNKDGAVTLAEAFAYAQREVARFYQQNNRIATETATLSGNGAESFVLRSPRTKAADPVLRQMYADRDALEQRINTHKANKSSMAVDVYEAELEKLLLQLAQLERRIRTTEQGN